MAETSIGVWAFGELGANIVTYPQYLGYKSGALNLLMEKTVH